MNRTNSVYDTIKIRKKSKLCNKYVFFQFVINASVPELSQQRTRIQKGCDLT